MNDSTQKLLLSAVYGAVEKHRRLRSAAGRDFNVFRVCGVDYYETMHSRIIAEFLNPQGAHGCGSKFLRRFVQVVGVELCGDVDRAIVYTEESSEFGRCDITIHVGGEVVIIENKIYAVDQAEQLARYDSWARQEKLAPHILYLTLDGRDASQDSSNGGRIQYARISYVDDILTWLRDCVSIAAERPYVRETLSQYINLVCDLAGRSSKEELIMEVVGNMIATRETFDASCEIVNSIRDARKSIAKKVMQTLEVVVDKDERFARWRLQHDELYGFVEDTSRHNHWVWFGMVPRMAGKYYLRCEFQGLGNLDGLFVGICACKPADAKDLRGKARSAGLPGVYADDNNGSWIYGTYISDGGLKDWNDKFLGEMLDDAVRQEAVERIASVMSKCLVAAEKALGHA